MSGPSRRQAAPKNLPRPIRCESTFAQVTPHSSDRLAALAWVRSGISAATQPRVCVLGCTLSSGDVLDGVYDRRFDRRAYMEVMG
jgi:hypothetical protein